MSKPYIRVDYSKFKARMDRMKARGNDARTAYTLALGATFVQNVVRLAPVDTHRYVRGWMEAARGAQIQTSGLPAIQDSKRRDELVAALSLQVNKTRNWLSTLEFRRDLWYERSGRPKRGYYNQLIGQINKQKERVLRAEEELDKFLKSQGGIVMARTTGAILNGYQRNISKDALKVTVRDKVYGGRGRLSKGTHRTGLFLHNLEPHCRVVEKYRAVVRRANMVLRTGGIVKLRGVYVDAVTKGTRDAQRRVWFGRKSA